MMVKRLHTAQVTAQLILDQITKYPETHNQDEFENTSPYRNCPTMRCVAGWAAHFNGYTMSDAGDVGTLGQELLDLTDGEAQWLFFRTDNDMAVKAVRQLAAGQKFTVPAERINPYF